MANNFVRSMNQLFFRKNLFAPLYTSFLLLLLLILGQLGLTFYIEHLNHEAYDKVTQTVIVQRQGNRLLNALIDEERSLLEDYSQKQFVTLEERGKDSAFSDTFNDIYELLQDNVAQVKQLNTIIHLHNYWQSNLEPKAVSTSIRNSRNRGSDLFNALRTNIRILIQREEILLDERINKLDRLYHINILISSLSTIAIFLGVGFNVRFLYRRAEIPLHKLTEVSKLWRQGIMEVQFGYSSRDEIGQLARVLDGMASEVYQRQQRIEVRNQNFEELFCALSHDLRTPLLATRTTLNCMLKGAFGSVNDLWKEVFEECHQANKDILKLVDSLLNVSRYEVNQGTNLTWEVLDWKRIFTKVIVQIKATSEHDFPINYKIFESLPIVIGDEIEIQRVLQNLLDNAARVSEPNKQILLDVVKLGKNQVKIYVCDQGLGIAPEEKKQLFHRFMQGRGRRGKAGLGLYLCRQIIEAHSGTIGVESSLGKGSTFWFTLPLNTDKASFHHGE